MRNPTYHTGLPRCVDPGSQEWSQDYSQSNFKGGHKGPNRWGNHYVKSGHPLAREDTLYHSIFQPYAFAFIDKLQIDYYCLFLNRGHLAGGRMDILFLFSPTKLVEVKRHTMR